MVQGHTNLGLALGMTLKFHTSVAKGLKFKVREFCGLSLTIVEVTGEKLVGGLFAPLILNRVKCQHNKIANDELFDCV